MDVGVVIHDVLAGLVVEGRLAVLAAIILILDYVLGFLTLLHALTLWVLAHL